MSVPGPDCVGMRRIDGFSRGHVHARSAPGGAKDDLRQAKPM